MLVSRSMLHHFNSFRSMSKGDLVLHFLHNDYTRWITANEVLCIFKQKVFTTRQAMSVERNSEARSRNHCCLGKPITITYSLCVSVALVTQHAKRMRRIAIRDLSSSDIFPLYPINGTIFRKKKVYRT